TLRLSSAIALPSTSSFSILLGQEHRRRRPIRLCDDPKLRAGLRPIRRQQSVAVLDRAIVRRNVLRVQVTPVAARMPAQCPQHLAWWHGILNPRGHQHPPKLELVSLHSGVAPIILLSLSHQAAIADFGAKYKRQEPDQ